MVAAAMICTIASDFTQANKANQQPDPELAQILREAADDASSFSDRFAATVWLADMSNRLKRHMPDTAQRVTFLKHVHYEAKRAGLDPQLVLALIQVESNFNQFAISRVGARGYMQIMPFWLKIIGHKDDNLFNMRTNLRFGCTILSYYLKKEKGNLTRALARYNGSLGRYKYPRKIYRALDNRWYAQ